jgi:hypothetical protein
MITKSPEFHGVELTQDVQLPIAFVMSRESYTFSSTDQKQFNVKDHLKHFDVIRLLASTAPNYQEVKQGGATYLPTIDGLWVRQKDFAIIAGATPPDGLQTGEKWIDVSIKTQTLLAYEGSKPVFATLVSTGRDGTNVKGKHATVQGEYRVRDKHIAATMDGDAEGDTYSIDDVPYIQYFHEAYALHGAFWHSDYGHVHSHGCVNLSPTDAKRLFFWTEPQLPKGWHGISATDDHPGTRVITHP